MATNRHAQIRYNILDRCFSNFNRLYDYNDLLEELNTTLFELGTEGIKLRQLQYDIEHMQSDAGWAIELEEGLRKGRKKAFRYADSSYSIANHPLNVNDTEQLETTLAILSRYKHREEFSWLEELIPRMQQAFKLADKGENGIISYQENVDLKGREHIGVLFNLILKKKQIKINYKPYGKDPIEAVLSPFHLKQYNNRWFLFAKHSNYPNISNYPLDRIESIEELTDDAEENDIDWMDYFDDIIGVTHPENDQIERVKLKFSERRIDYVKTKPLHGTQRLFKEDDSALTITLEVIPNLELIQLILSFGPDVEVLEPKSLRNKITEKIDQLKQIY
jgi:predicted DNA-binding transcriptional regulator YafY